MSNKSNEYFSSAVKIVILFGIISMCGDAVYESARSANSQYLSLLNISAAQVGLVFGIGEFLGYFLRLISGVFSDKSGRHWLFMFIGYGMLFAVPLIGFTTNWNIIIPLILMERIGKALRSPAKDTILSSVAEGQIGLGFAFGIQEALDQVGAFIGPIIFTMFFYFSKNKEILQYQMGYKALFIPFIILMLVLVCVYRKINSENIVPKAVSEEDKQQINPIFWLYTSFTFFCTLGFVNFSIVGYHLKANNLMSDGNITLIYSIAMIVDAIAALLVGKAYDFLKTKTKTKFGGLLVLMIIPIITLFLPYLTLSYSVLYVVIGMIIFGIVMGTHETIMRSAIADITPFNKRGTGYGIFNTSYGLALLCGSSLMGLLYDMNKTEAIIILTFAAELIAIILYLKMNIMIKKSNKSSS